jgi:hypothetical protein
VDLARSFPGVRTLVLRCDGDAGEGWAARFVAFVARNLAALQQLEHLEVKVQQNTAATLDSIAQLTGLRSLGMWASGLQPSSWSALRSLAQLTSLRVCPSTDMEDRHLPHIAAAAPQLQQLHYTSFGTLRPQCASSLASLRSLASLQLMGPAERSAQMARALAALPCLTHLDLHLLGERSQEAPQFMQALGQLTGLASLKVDGYVHHGYRPPLAPLEALQQLTHLSLGRGIVQLPEFAVLARLGALRALEAHFQLPAAAAAAGLQRLQGVTALLTGLEAAGPLAPIQLAEGCCLRLLGGVGLRCFVTRQVHMG